jgi:hypothetical protein
MIAGCLVAFLCAVMHALTAHPKLALVFSSTGKRKIIIIYCHQKKIFQEYCVPSVQFSHSEVAPKGKAGLSFVRHPLPASGVSESSSSFNKYQ